MIHCCNKNNQDDWNIKIKNVIVLLSCLQDVNECSTGSTAYVHIFHFVIKKYVFILEFVFVYSHMSIHHLNGTSPVSTQYNSIFSHFITYHYCY